MPELPEVETVVRRLNDILPGRKIKSCQIHWKRSIAVPNGKTFASTLEGLRFKVISRRGKYIICHLSSNWNLLIHLRMSGDLVTRPSRAERSKHEHVIIKLSGGIDLRFDDTRKFGKMYLVSDLNEVTGKLGLEPLEKEFKPEILFQLCQLKRSKMKTLLLDQSFIAGLGNIYVVEALWASRIHPLREACSVSRSEARDLHRSIIRILKRAINSRGTDIGDGVWKTGQYLTKVYGREGKPCRRCRTSIERMVVGQRGTEYCPRCQR